MIKISFSLFIIILLVGCKQSPTYNAFDKEFDVSIKEVMSNGCDTISAGCGYFNLQQKEGRLRHYYQVYMESPYKVVAKGFDYYLDTLICKPEEGYDKFLSVKISDESIMEFNDELKKFGYVFNRRKKREFISGIIEVINYETKDTVDLSLIAFRESTNDTIVLREIRCFKSNK